MMVVGVIAICAVRAMPALVAPHRSRLPRNGPRHTPHPASRAGSEVPGPPGEPFGSRPPAARPGRSASRRPTRRPLPV